METQPSPPDRPGTLQHIDFFSLEMESILWTWRAQANTHTSGCTAMSKNDLEFGAALTEGECSKQVGNRVILHSEETTVVYYSGIRNAVQP